MSIITIKSPHMMSANYNSDCTKRNLQYSSDFGGLRPTLQSLVSTTPASPFTTFLVEYK